MSWIAAIDLGASSGRVIIGKLSADRLVTREVHRFANETVRLPGAAGATLCWSITGLFAEICKGLERAIQEVGTLEAIGIDTWGVDYGLLDADGVLAAPVVHYRDRRTHDVPGQVSQSIDPQRLYELNGTQVQEFNTVYQLVASADSSALQRASSLVLVPDLLGYWLTGVQRAEVTNASTTGLIDPATRTWSQELLDALPEGSAIQGLLPTLAEPGTILGPVLPDVVPGVVNAAGEPTPVVHVGSHDTASAVVGVPAQQPNFAYISSGTWSLVGLELDEPVLTEASRADNFTNELGVDGTVRYLKNVSGMWTFNHCLAEWRSQDGGRPIDITRLLTQAADEPSLARVVDLNHPSLVAPGPMTQRINDLLVANGQPPATTRVQTVRAIMDSLALAYRAAIELAGSHAGREVDVVHIVGGGSRNAHLCQQTADATGRPVIAGPAEGTALGNLLVTARAIGQLDGGLDRLRAVGAASSDLTLYRPTLSPRTSEAWLQAAQLLNSMIKNNQKG